MQGRKYALTWNFHGTLSANGVGRFTVENRAVLRRIQFSCSGATAATLDFGTAADGDGYIDGGAVGQSGAVAVFDRDDFNGVLYTDADNIENIVLEPGTVYVFTVIHASAVDAAVVFEIIE
jgi:hypothetical protein